MKLLQNKRIQTIGAISIVLPILVLVYIFLIPIADFFVFGIGNFTPQTHLAQAIHFFIYDTIKILILLFIISSLMGIVNAYFPVERLRIFLTTKKCMDCNTCLHRCLELLHHFVRAHQFHYS